MSDPKVCERCKEPHANCGPWDGTGGFRWLCGGCKVRVTLDDPKRRKRFEDNVRRAFETIVREKPTGGES